MVFASLPSPGSSSISIGPLDLRAYGILIALGVMAAVWLTQRRWAAEGRDPEEVVRIATWAVPGGIVGARIYHVVTDNQRFRGDWWSALEIWKGGLGIWGAVAGGALAAIVVVRRSGLSVDLLAWSIAPALPLAQAIGRFGNWFNQELFGRPSDLPWALEIDPSHRPSGYADVETFHPTFLYEALWNLALVGFLIWLGPRLRRRFRPGALFAVYVMGYTVGRLWIELLRIDPANEVLGLRINVWTSILVFLGGLIALLLLRRPARAADLEAAPDEGSAPDADDEPVEHQGDPSVSDANG